MIWDFIQKQVLGMKWLNELIGSLLEKAGLDISDKLGGSILLLFIHTFIYRFYKCRSSVRSYVLFSDFVSYGRFGKFGLTDEYIWNKSGRSLCCSWINYRNNRRYFN